MPRVSSLVVAFAVVVACATAVALGGYRRDRRGVYIAAKAVASVSFVALAGLGFSADVAWETPALVALALSAIGDVALGFRGRKPFVIGLTSFAIAHATFSVAFILRGVQPLVAAGFAAVALVAATVMWLKRRHSVPIELRLPIALYVAIICVMASTGLASALARPGLFLGVGAILVPGSDIAVARERFGTPSFRNKLVGLPAYYLGQVLIALSLFG